MRKPLALLLAVVAVVCCSKLEQPVQVPQPEGYADLYTAYKSGKRYISITRDGTFNIITLEDKSTVAMRLTDITIHDCREKSPSVTAVNKDGVWMLAGIPLGILEENDVTDADAVPVYIYYTGTELSVRLSNHGNFIIKYIDPDLVGTIPTLSITTKNNQAINSKEEYVEGSLHVHDPYCKFSSVTEFDASMKIRGRGNSTWWLAKKPYKIKFDEKRSFFGLDKDKEWCLLANYTDKSLVRNITAMEISRICGMAWTPTMKSCEVNLNGKYQGVYSFCEHKKISKGRVNIDTDNGDILFELDENQDEPVSWVTTHGAPIMFSEPSEPTEEQIAASKKYFADIETALWNKDFSAVYSMIDRDSFINNYIIQELTMNVDGNFRRSNFLTLKKGGKLTMYFVWDFDLSMGNADFYGNPPGKGPTGWWVKEFGSWGRHQGWYYRLFMDPEFAKAVKTRWNAIYAELKVIPSYIDKQVAIIGEDAVKRNFNVWSFTDNGWWNASRNITTYDYEIEYFKSFYTKRLAWLNTQLNAL